MMRSSGAVYRSVLLAAATAGTVLLSAVPALAVSGPLWSVQSVAAPTNMQRTDAVSAVQQVTVSATGGTFTLSFEGQTTKQIAYNASAASVESELDALSSVGAVGGSVIVTEDPGNEPSEHDYVVTFDGTLRGVEGGACYFSCNLAIAADGTSLTLGGGEGAARVTSITRGSTNDEYDVQVENIGGSASSGMITVTDKLPPGVTTTTTAVAHMQPENLIGTFACSGGAGLSEVTWTGEPLIASGPLVSYNDGVATAGVGILQILIPVTVSADAAGSVVNTATVSGGGAARDTSVSSTNPLNSSTPPAFGLSYFNALVSDEVGAPFTQAGGHPYAATVNFGFNMEVAPGLVGAAPGQLGINSVAEDDSREIAVDLPLGWVGNPLATPRCSLVLVADPGANTTHCPRDTQVGVVYMDYSAAGSGEGPGLTGPFALFNVVPEPGRPGEFAYNPIGGVLGVLYGVVVRTPLGNVVRLMAPITRAFIKSVSATFFGNPVGVFSKPTEEGTGVGPGEGTDGRPFEDKEELPFLISPTNCQASEAQRTLTMHVDSWQHTGAQNPDGTPDFSDPNWKEASTVLPPVEGCDQLEFDPSHFEQAPSGLLVGSHEAKAGGTTRADEPSAYEGRLKIPQVETFGTLSRPELKSATVTLPAGVSVSASYRPLLL